MNNKKLEEKKAQLDPNDEAVKLVLSVASYLVGETVGFDQIDQDQINQIIQLKKTRSAILEAKAKQGA